MPPSLLTPSHLEVLLGWINQEQIEGRSFRVFSTRGQLGGGLLACCWRRRQFFLWVSEGGTEKADLHVRILKPAHIPAYGSASLLTQHLIPEQLPARPPPWGGSLQARPTKSSWDTY